MGSEGPIDVSAAVHEVLDELRQTMPRGIEMAGAGSIEAGDAVIIDGGGATLMPGLTDGS